MKRYTRLLVDGNNLVHRMRHAYAGLRSDYKDLPTGTLYGVIKAMEVLMRRFSPMEIVVCWDCMENSWRTDKYTWYKADRRERIAQESVAEAEARHEFYHVEVPDVKDVLYKLGIPQITIPGMEADDIIAVLAWSRPIFISDLILSTDKDLVQLVRRHLCRVLSPHADRERMFYQHDVLGHIMCNGPAGIDDLAPSPKVWLWRRAVMGDKSDSIKGIDGVGEVRAHDMLDQPEWKAETIDKYLLRMKIGKSAYGKRVLDNIPIIQRNLSLMDLRFATWESDVLYKEYRANQVSNLFCTSCTTQNEYDRYLLTGTHLSRWDGMPEFLKDPKADPSRALNFFRRRDFSVAFYPIQWQNWIGKFVALYNHREHVYNETRARCSSS